MKQNLPSATAFLLLLFFPLRLIAQWNTGTAINNPVVINQGRQESSVSCSDGAGGAIVAWYDNRNTLYDVFVQRINSNGQTLWTAGGISLNVVTSGFGDIDIADDGQGGAVIAFISGSGGSLQILAQKVNAAGEKQWNAGNPLIVCDATGAQYNPKVVNAGNTFVIAWQDERSGNADIYAQKLSFGGMVQWTPNGVVVNAAVNDQIMPEITAIGSEEVMVTWDDFRSGTNADIYAQKLNAAGVRQWRGTDNLLSGRLISGAAANQRFPKICTDGSSGAMIAWQDFRDGASNSTDIYAQRIDSSGTVKWAANGIVLSATTSVQNIFDMVFTGNGAVVSWLHFPVGGDVDSYNIYAQKTDTNGVVQWSDTGLAVCNAPQLQNTPALAHDGSGGIFCTWIDKRSGFAAFTEIYAQRINSNGTAAWQQNGVLICNTQTNSRNNPQVVADGCSAVIIWDDDRNSCCSIVDVDIYATKIDCDGNVFGSSTGISWTGTISTNWQTPGNWSSNAVPTINDNVTIAAGTPFSPVINTGVMAACKTIRVNTGATVTIATGGDLKVSQ
jgi:hypothetical protein